MTDDQRVARIVFAALAIETRRAQARLSDAVQALEEAHRTAEKALGDVRWLCDQSEAAARHVEADTGQDETETEIVMTEWPEDGGLEWA